MSTETPRRLVQVVDNSASPPAPAVPARPPAIGQIWIAQPDEGPGLLVLVTDVNDDNVRALVCSDDGDVAADTDSVLERHLTGCPYRLLVHGDLACSILTTRLSYCSGRIDRELVPRIVRRGRGMDYDSRDLGRGTPIVSESDPRVAAKTQKLKLLRTVQARQRARSEDLPAQTLTPLRLGRGRYRYFPGGPRGR
jgi:hypothetical protein